MAFRIGLSAAPFRHLYGLCAAELARISHTRDALRRAVVSQMGAKAATSVSGHTVERLSPPDGRRGATLWAG